MNKSIPNTDINQDLGTWEKEREGGGSWQDLNQEPCDLHFNPLPIMLPIN